MRAWSRSEKTRWLKSTCSATTEEKEDLRTKREFREPFDWLGLGRAVAPLTVVIIARTIEDERTAMRTRDAALAPGFGGRGHVGLPA